MFDIVEQMCNENKFTFCNLEWWKLDDIDTITTNFCIHIKTKKLVPYKFVNCFYNKMLDRIYIAENSKVKSNVNAHTCFGIAKNRVFFNFYKNLFNMKSYREFDFPIAKYKTLVRVEYDMKILSSNMG